MAGRIASSMTYCAASKLSESSRGEANIAHAPQKSRERFQAPSIGMRVFGQIFCLKILIPFMGLPKIGALSSALNRYEDFRTDFLPNNPHTLYGPSPKPSDRDRIAQPAKRWVAERKR